MQLRKILVPVDFSACSRMALEYAAQLAERFGASIEVLHVWEQPQYLGTGFGELTVGLPEGRTMLAELVRRRARVELDEFLSQVQHRAGVKLTGRLEVGDPRERILKAAAGGRPDLIVMGTRGRRNLARVVMGSVAESIVRRAACPVLTLRESDASAAGARGASAA